MAATKAEPDSQAIAVERFGPWMKAEQRRIYLLCLRMLRDPEEADSAAQDAFFKAYRAIDRGDAREVEEPGKWLTRIAVNTCLDRLRSRRWQFWRKRPDQESEWTILAMAPSASPGPDSGVHSQEIARRLAAALELLSDRQRSVFVLKHFEDRSLDEIGQILGLDTGTVKAHMARALSKLRAELKDLYGRHALERR